MADPVQARAKEKRLAEALRANLKRRKEQARERAADERDGQPSSSMRPQPDANGETGQTSS